MAASSVEKSSVVNFSAWREGRTATEAGRGDIEELKRELEKEREALAEERRILEQAKASFEEDFLALEDQRRFLDIQKESLRQEALDLEARREEVEQAQSRVAQVAKAAQRVHIEAALDEARKSSEAERLQLQSEMAALLRPASAKAKGEPAS
jgi:DNA repair exonuclease SbcCD ATPase subunit